MFRETTRRASASAFALVRPQREAYHHFVSSTGPAVEPAFRLYANLIPESLVASNLDPAAYGTYMAVGESGSSRGQAIYFEVDAAMVPEDFSLDEARTRCRPGRDGTPKHSVYLAVYRVLERLPMKALGALNLVTDDGRLLSLHRADPPPDAGGLHYYQEFAPIMPRVLSRLGPHEFARHLTAAGHAVSMPRVVFAELRLPDQMEEDAGDLPYTEMAHLRDCMRRMLGDPQKQTKMITRSFHAEVMFRTILNGFFVGDAAELLYYPLPSAEKLKEEHFAWWRSAQTMHTE